MCSRDWILDHEIFGVSPIPESHLSEHQPTSTSATVGR